MQHFPGLVFQGRIKMRTLYDVMFVKRKLSIAKAKSPAEVNLRVTLPHDFRATISLSLDRYGNMASIIDIGIIYQNVIGIVCINVPDADTI